MTGRIPVGDKVAAERPWEGVFNLDYPWCKASCVFCYAQGGALFCQERVHRVFPPNGRDALAISKQVLNHQRTTNIMISGKSLGEVYSLRHSCLHSSDADNVIWLFTQSKPKSQSLVTIHMFDWNVDNPQRSRIKDLFYLQIPNLFIRLKKRVKFNILAKKTMRNCQYLSRV